MDNKCFNPSKELPAGLTTAEHLVNLRFVLFQSLKGATGRSDQLAPPSLRVSPGFNPSKELPAGLTYYQVVPVASLPLVSIPQRSYRPV